MYPSTQPTHGWQKRPLHYPKSPGCSIPHHYRPPSSRSWRPTAPHHRSSSPETPAPLTDGPHPLFLPQDPPRVHFEPFFAVLLMVRPPPPLLMLLLLLNYLTKHHGAVNRHHLAHAGAPGVYVVPPPVPTRKPIVRRLERPRPSPERLPLASKKLLHLQHSEIRSVWLPLLVLRPNGCQAAPPHRLRQDEEGEGRQHLFRRPRHHPDPCPGKFKFGGAM